MTIKTVIKTMPYINQEDENVSRFIDGLFKFCSMLKALDKRVGN